MKERWEAIFPLAEEAFSQEGVAIIRRALEEIETRSKTPSLGFEMALLLLDIFPDLDTVIAGMFAEAGDFFGENEIEQSYGQSISLLTKSFLDLHFQEKMSSLYRKKQLLRSIFLGLLRDHRILFFLLADRLLCIREYFFFHQDEKEALAKEAFEVLAPLSSRLGIRTYKEEFQDSAFRILYPNDYARVSEQMSYLLANNMSFLESIEEKISTTLAQKNIAFVITSRKKGLYSIFKKLKEKGLSNIFDIFDIFALRIVVNTIEDCYRTLGIIHQIGIPVLGRVKDYIASPKSNGYQTLHTIILVGASDWETEEINPLEIQIRTRKMNENAEKGVASHLFYKERETRTFSLFSSEKWMKNLDQANGHGNSSDFLADFSENIFKGRIFVFTDHGDVKELPKNSTPVDFAFAVHTEVGERCIGSRVNGKMVPLDTKLQNGDTVEILIRTNAIPHEHWLSFVKSSAAKNRIRSFFRKKEKEEFFRIGKKMLNTELRKKKLPLLDQKLTLLQNFQKLYKYAKSKEDVVEAIGSGDFKIIDVFQRLFPKKIEESEHQKKRILVSSDKKKELRIAGEKGIQTHMACCCNPKEGDDVVAYTTIFHSISIHKKSCKFVKNFDESRILDAKWE
jgi:GTP diphosphokinase / guanosine-3',5'-bis(diphosphate) 3'-diphosphatase